MSFIKIRAESMSFIIIKTTYSVYFEVPQVLHLLQAGQAYPVQTYMHNIVIVYM